MQKGRRLTVRLTPEQISFAKKIGHQRHFLHNDTGRVDPLVDKSRTGLEIDIQGACAEMAVSVALKREWDGAFLKLKDWRIWRKVGHDVDGLQVRCTNYTTGGLCVHKSDPDNHPFILVVDRDAPDYVLIGWIFAREAKLSLYWDETLMNKRPCYLVPQIDLRPCTELAREPRQGTSGGGRRDPAPDFAGTGRFPQMRYADDGGPPTKYGRPVPASWALPCCRCQTIIQKGELVSGNLVTGSIHGDPAACKMKPRSGKKT